LVLLRDVEEYDFPADPGGPAWNSQTWFEELIAHRHQDRKGKDELLACKKGLPAVTTS